MKKYKILPIFVSLMLVILMPAMMVTADDSTVTITFTPGSGPVAPVDPDDPTSPSTGDDTDGITTEETGPLTLDFITNLNFGSQSIHTTTSTFHAATLKPYIQVSDRRGAETGEGWKVTVESTALTNAASDAITGAYITLSNGMSLSSTGNNTNAPTPNSPVVINADGTSIANVVTAQVGTGVGTWITRWYPTASDAASNNNVTLTVPANPVAGSYTATLTWTLSDAL